VICIKSHLTHIKENRKYIVDGVVQSNEPTRLVQVTHIISHFQSRDWQLVTVDKIGLEALISPVLFSMSTVHGMLV